MEGKDIKNAIDSLNKRKSELDKELAKVKNAIDALQKICKHNMEYEGHDSHKDYYVCTYCGESDSR
jgi:hypothetical protein